MEQTSGRSARTLAEAKDVLRKSAVMRRNALTPAERAAFSEAAVRRIAALAEFEVANTVMLYRAVRGELPLESLLSHPAAKGKRFCFPRCGADHTLEALVPGGWRAGAYGIPEPDPAVSGAVPPDKIGLIICPGAAFDGSLNRLGMGGGRYDRFLPRCSGAFVVMAAFECQRAASVPCGPYDVPMQCVVTERGVYRP